MFRPSLPFVKIDCHSVNLQDAPTRAKRRRLPVRLQTIALPRRYKTTFVTTCQAVFRLLLWCCCKVNAEAVMLLGPPTRRPLANAPLDTTQPRQAREHQQLVRGMVGWKALGSTLETSELRRYQMPLATLVASSLSVSPFASHHVQDLYRVRSRRLPPGLTHIRHTADMRYAHVPQVVKLLKPGVTSPIVCCLL